MLPVGQAILDFDFCLIFSLGLLVTGLLVFVIVTDRYGCGLDTLLFYLLLLLDISNLLLSMVIIS